MKRIKIKISGVSPLLMHAFTDADQINATTGSRASSAAAERDDPKERARRHLYLSADGETIIMPQPNIFSAIVSAGRFFKNGRSKITTLRSSLIPACVFFDEVEYPLEHDGWSVDTRAVRIPSTGGRIQRHRPIFHKWSLPFECLLDTEEMSEGLLRQIVDAAGNKVGLGDFRPETKGPFGRFVVTLWDSEENATPAPAAAK